MTNNKQTDLFGDAGDSEAKRKAAMDLVRISEAMEQCESNSPFRKQLVREYKLAMVAAGITNAVGRVTNAKDIPATKIKEGREAALVKVKEYLDNIEHWSKELRKLCTGQEGYIAVSYSCNTNSGIPGEIQFKICDSFYGSYSGYKCIKAQVSLFHEKQISGYPSIEYGLIRFGMALLSKKQDKVEFFKKYAVPYNERIKGQEGKKNQKGQ